MPFSEKKYIIGCILGGYKMATAVVHTRLPQKIEAGLGMLVQDGYYSSTADALRDGARRLIEAHYGLLKGVAGANSIESANTAKEKIWKSALKKANGNKRAAAGIVIREANKIRI